jgi:5-methylcytosine-specific restriction protein A
MRSEVLMKTALYINGIFNSVLVEILEAQKNRAGGISYLQPHSGQIARSLKERAPSPENPIRLYISTSANLSLLSYTAEIIGWEDKRELSAKRKKEVTAYLRKWQEGERSFEGVNLITIQDLTKLKSRISTGALTKTSNDLPLKERKQAGGWSEVYDAGNFARPLTQTLEQADAILTAEIGASFARTSEDRGKRLAAASKIPEKIQIISTGYRRNADVIVTVLFRANGFCEKCGAKAPFQRRSNGSPYLEVHHLLPLALGGEDTVKNAKALCPNCHRELHHA